jgi:ribosomal protein S21
MVNCTIVPASEETADSFLRRLRTQTDREGVFKDMQRMQCFVSKSARRTAKSRRARARVLKDGRA